MDLWIGTSGFQYAEWKGGFYPAKLPASKMLPYYADRFASTEVNYSFRRIPSAKTIQNWSNATPSRFKFTFKAPQKVTHIAKLRDCVETMAYFAKVLLDLKDKLGIVLFQLPPGMKCDAPLLRSFLSELPAGIQAAFEFRHPSWFADEVYATLRDHNSALCIAENETLATPAIPTADFGYLRLRREDYSARDIKHWAEFVRTQVNHWKDVFIYFKHEDTGLGPKFAQQMIGALNG